MATEEKRIYDGGPAFPVEVDGWHIERMDAERMKASGSYPGMSLRDYFAAKAMQGLAASCVPLIEGDPDQSHVNAWARIAYQTADAMLKVR